MFQILIYFLCENHNPPPPEKVHPPPLSQQPPVKVDALSSPRPLFENLVGGSTSTPSPIPQQKGRCTLLLVSLCKATLG